MPTKGQSDGGTPLDERIGVLVDVVDTGAATVVQMMEHLPTWSRPTCRRVLRECERMGVLRRQPSAVRADAPGRPSDLWELA